MESTETQVPQQAGAEGASLFVRSDALNVVCAWLVLFQPSAAFELLEYLHASAARVPEHARAYMMAADEVREAMGFDRLMGSDT